MAGKPTVGVSLALKLDDALLGRSGQQIQQQTDKMAKTAGNNWADRFTKSAQVDPTKLASTAQFGQHGQKLGKSMGDSVSDGMRRGDFAGAARDSARAFEVNFEKFAKPKVGVDTSQMAKSGDTAGNSFSSGFASAGGLTKLAGKGGPIFTAIVAAGTLAAKALQPIIAEAMRVDAEISMAGARAGLNPKQLAEYRKLATEAWGRNSGASIDANVSTAVAAMQSGLGVDQATVEQLNAVSSILGEEIPAAARSAGQLIRTGLAGNAKEAFDILVAGQQNGLNVSQDWLDTIDEYSTQFRALGLTGADAIGLLSQMTKAGARNTDVAADALKELAIRAQDGSKATTDAFNRLGLNAAEMASKISAGGSTARAAFDQILDAIRNTRDPVQQMQIAVALLGTKAEDLGDAFKAIDLTTAANSIKGVEGAAQNAADTALRTSQNEWQQAGRNIQKIWQDVKDSLDVGNWFSQVPKSFNELFADAPKLTPGAPGVPIWNGPGIGPPTANGPLNPLDVIAGQHASGVPGTPPPAPPGPAPGQWWGPNMVAPPVNPRFGSQYDRADSKGGSSGGQSGPVVPFSGNAMDLLNGHPVNSSTFGAAQSLLEAQHKAAQESAELNAIMADNTATAEAITKARNELQAAETDQLQAQLRFNEAMTSAATGMAEGMQGISSNFAEIGANLDNDLGISKGLPGLADNLVRFIASLAAAPIQGMLAPIANGAKGSGILGMLGVGQDDATPTTQGYLPQFYSMPSTPYGLPGSTNTGGYGSGGAVFPPWVHALENIFGVKASTYAGHQTSDRNEPGYAPNPNGENRGIDWSGPVDAMQRFADYLAKIPGALEQVIWQNPNTGASTEIAGGVPQPGYFAGDLGGHQDHVHTRQSAAIPTPGMWPSASPGPWPGGATPSGALPGTPSPITQLPYAQPAGMAPQPGSTFPSSPLPAPGTVPTGGPLGSGFPNAFTPGPSPGYTPDTPAAQPQSGWAPQGGGAGISGGLLGTAISAASSAAGMGANMFAPGSGAAAQAAADMAMKAINRTIAFGGQAAGIAAEGLMETFKVSDPDGGSNGGPSWIQRIAGGLSGMKPAGGMAAGKLDKEPKAEPQQGRGGPTVHIENFVQAENRNGMQVPNDLAYAAASAQMNPG